MGREDACPVVGGEGWERAGPSRWRPAREGLWGASGGARRPLVNGAGPVCAPLQNLKKSWHPQTLRNVEKVWKAEQKREAERKKVEELRRWPEDTGPVP